MLSLVILLIATISLDVVSAIKNTSILVIFKDAFVKLYRALPEFFLLQNIGFYDGGINYPLWQVCTLLIAGYFIYTLLKKNEKMTIQLICPISVISIYTLLYINKVEAFGFYGFIYFPLLRAFGPMCLGVLIYRFIISNDYEKLLKSKYHVLLNVFSLLSLIFLFVCNAYGYNYLILFVIIILELFNEKSLINKLLNRKIFSSFGDLSYAIYLNHALIIGCYTYLLSVLKLNVPKWGTDIVYVIILVAYSILTMKIVNHYKKKHLQKS